MPGAFYISVRNGIRVAFRNGREAYALFLKASQFTRNDEVYSAVLTEANSEWGWLDVAENTVVTIPISNIAGYQWVPEESPAPPPGPVDLDALRKLINPFPEEPPSDDHGD